jgi:hypothetical protein
MFWSVIGFIGGGSFLVNGFSVLGDPDCATVGFSGGRAVQVTCYPEGSIYDTSGIPGTVGGLGMVLVGSIILYFSWNNFRRS